MSEKETPGLVPRGDESLGDKFSDQKKESNDNKFIEKANHDPESGSPESLSAESPPVRSSSAENHLDTESTDVAALNEESSGEPYQETQSLLEEDEDKENRPPPSPPARKVLIVIDDSPETRSAFFHYLDSLHRPGDRIMLYYPIVYSNPDQCPSFSILQTRVKALAQECLISLRAAGVCGEMFWSVQTPGPTTACGGSRRGFAAMQLACRFQVHLIILGLNGTTAWHRYYLSGEVDFVMRHAHCRVVCVVLGRRRPAWIDGWLRCLRVTCLKLGGEDGM